MTRQTPGTATGRAGATHCAECGTRAEPGQAFCDSCGEVLRWTDNGGGEREASAAPVTAAPETARDPGDSGSAGGPGSPGDTGRPAAAADDTAPAAAQPASAPDTTSTPAAATPAAPDGDAAPAAADNPDDTTARARSLLVPVQDPEPRAAARPSVAAVLPGRPDADRPQVRAPGPEPVAEGGVPCSVCATPNRPDRHFCARCATPMSVAAGAPAPRHRPWWRRLLDFRNREAPWAGDRPRLRRSFERVLRVIVGLLVVTALVTAAFQVGDAYNAIRDHFAKRAPVAPDKITASKSYIGQQPELVIDKLNNTWWGPGINGSGEGEWLEARFDKPTRMLDLVITPGVSIRPDQLSKSAQPHRVDALVTDAKGKTFTRSLTLDQGAGAQRIPFRVGEVTAIRFIVRSAYGASTGKQVAIAEIEFFGPSKSGRSSG
ncbi:NADase-type glycan-binding domain-containing protein [Streptomyces sp. NPDC127084]|uniref:NADase-type glycan-binding domain-containing protein n=1 Tax=Streptomyces sp. NPDC127084 TaxID=3347133 RepID=UPI003646D348